jgi:D-methionine transport system substrate-binding protein
MVMAWQSNCKGKIFMKIKLLLLITGLLAANAFAADEVIKIGATSVPHAEILQQAKPMLKKQGIDLQIKEFSDYVQPNFLVDQKQLDANFFQHRPYLEQFNKERGTNLVELTGVHIEPMGIYASGNPKLVDFVKGKNISKLPQGLLVGVPNDTTNEGRALLLLQKNGFITIKDGVKYPTKKDIVTNNYKISFTELDPAMLPRAMKASQLDLAVINSNFAMQAGINPLKDAIFIEDANSPYVNIVVVRADNKDLPKLKKLANVLQSVAIKQYITTNYKGAVIPVTK